jgi:hypothetical protein
MKRTSLVAGLVLGLVFMATATGIFYRPPEGPRAHITVRGEEATLQGNGLYRYDPAFLAREAIIWDGINLLVGVPLLAAGILLTRRHSLRGRLLLAGLLSYFFYVYLMYATMMAFNELFLVYVAIFALCGVAFLLNLAQIEVRRLPTRLAASFPRRVFAVYMILLAAMLVVLWMGRIVPILATNRFPAELAGLTTLEPQALDLGLIVPLLRALQSIRQHKGEAGLARGLRPLGRGRCPRTHTAHSRCAFRQAGGARCEGSVRYCLA